MKCLSLFSGIGGFDLALQRKGHQIVGACEIDKHARQIYERHFPGVTVWPDATKLEPEQLPDFDLLCAGFPCQAFSLAGKRLGLEDTRGTLFYEIARIADKKRPRYILLENVKGILYHDEGRTLTTIIKTFYELGYDLEWQVINSKYFVPQNRERIFIICHLRGQPTRQVFPITEDDRLPIEREKESGTNVKCLTAGGHSGGLHSQMTLIPVLCVTRENRRQNGRRFKTNGEPMFTLTQQDQHGVYDGQKIRRLTPLEWERLQGFPDNWTDGLSDTQRYKCVGNAVTVPVIEYILSSITLGFEG